MLFPSNRVAVVLLLFATGCAAPARNDRVGESGSTIANQRTQDNAGTQTTSAYVTVPLDNTANEPEIIAWLRHAGVRIEKDANGDERVYDSLVCRETLVRYRRLQRLRQSITSQNIVNADTTHDVSGAKNPYRRKFVVVDGNGAAAIREDTSPYLKRYEPGHPDADAAGFVSYPNVDVAIETVNAREAEMEYRMASRMLQRLDPTVVNGWDADPMAEKAKRP